MHVSNVMAHISGPSGSGKSTLLDRLRDKYKIGTVDLDGFDDKAMAKVGSKLGIFIDKKGVKRIPSDQALVDLQSYRQKLLDAHLKKYSNVPIVLGGIHREGSTAYSLPTDNKFMLDTGALTSAWRGYKRSKKLHREDPTKPARKLSALPKYWNIERKEIKSLKADGYKSMNADEIDKKIGSMLGKTESVEPTNRVVVYGKLQTKDYTDTSPSLRLVEGVTILEGVKRRLTRTIARKRKLQRKRRKFRAKSPMRRIAARRAARRISPSKRRKRARKALKTKRKLYGKKIHSSVEVVNNLSEQMKSLQEVKDLIINHIQQLDPIHEDTHMENKEDKESFQNEVDFAVLLKEAKTLVGMNTVEETVDTQKEEIDPLEGLSYHDMLLLLLNEGISLDESLQIIQEKKNKSGFGGGGDADLSLGKMIVKHGFKAAGTIGSAIFGKAKRSIGRDIGAAAVGAAGLATGMAIHKGIKAAKAERGIINNLEVSRHKQHPDVYPHPMSYSPYSHAMSYGMMPKRYESAEDNTPVIQETPTLRSVSSREVDIYDHPMVKEMVVQQLMEDHKSSKVLEG